MPAVTAEDPLVAVIRWADVADRILRDHTQVNGRCPLCSAGGASSGKVLDHCNLWLAAREAKRNRG